MKRLLAALLVWAACFGGVEFGGGGISNGAGQGTSPVTLLLTRATGVSAAAARLEFNALGASEDKAFDGFPVQIVTVTARAAAGIRSALLATGNYDAVEYEQERPPAHAPNDELLSSGESTFYWALEEQPGGMNLIGSWHNTGCGASDPIIAILDSGVDADHPDLVDNLVTGFNFYNCPNGTGSNCNSTDDLTTGQYGGHGTKVAGVAGERGNNTIGYAGAAYTCRIMPIVATTLSGGASISGMVNGLDYARTHGAKLAVISFVLHDIPSVISASTAFRAAGGLVVMSAGNKNPDASACINAPNPASIISVSNTTDGDTIADSSCTGPWVDFSAPGTAICSTVRGGVYSCNNWGTSFSAPMLAGMIALRWGSPDESDLAQGTLDTPTKIEAWLKETAIDLGPAGYDPTFGWGRGYSATSHLP